MIHFNKVFHYKPSILGYHHLWKRPYLWLLDCLGVLVRWAMSSVLINEGMLPILASEIKSTWWSTLSSLVVGFLSMNETYWCSQCYVNVCIIFVERKRNLVHTSLKPSKPNRYIAVFSSSSEPPVVFVQLSLFKAPLWLCIWNKSNMKKMTLALVGYSQIIMFSKELLCFSSPENCFF